MAYQYVRATAVRNESLSGEQEIDITGLTLKDLVSNYSRIQIVYYDELYKKNYTLDISKYYQEFSQSTANIVVWLNDKGGKSIEHLTTLPGTKLNYVKAGDVQLYNYRLFPGDHLLNVDAQDALTPDSGPDIRVKYSQALADYRGNVKWQDVAKNALFTVNGHFCRAMGFNDALYLIGAGKNYLVNNNLHVNCLDFTGVSTLQSYPFEESQIIGVNDNGYRGVFIKIEKDLTNKDVWMVIGGRLIVGPGMIKKTGPNMFKVNLENMELANRLFESLDYINLIPALNPERKVIYPDELASNEFIKKLLLNENSFFIVFDTPVVGVTITPLQTHTYPTVFRANERFQHPVMLDNGLFPAYRTRYQHNVILMDVDIRYKPKRVNDSTGVANGGNLYHDGVDLYSPNSPVIGYSFKIHTLASE